MTDIPGTVSGPWRGAALGPGVGGLSDTRWGNCRSDGCLTRAPKRAEDFPSCSGSVFLPAAAGAATRWCWALSAPLMSPMWILVLGAVLHHWPVAYPAGVQWSLL